MKIILRISFLFHLLFHDSFICWSHCIWYDLWHLLFLKIYRPHFSRLHLSCLEEKIFCDQIALLLWPTSLSSPITNYFFSDSKVFLLQCSQSLFSQAVAYLKLLTGILCKQKHCQMQLMDFLMSSLFHGVNTVVYIHMRWNMMLFWISWEQTELVAYSWKYMYEGWRKLLLQVILKI